MIVSELFARLGFQVDRGSVQKVNQSLDKVKTQAEKTTNAMKNIATAIGVAGLVAGINRLGDLKDRYQALEAKLRSLPFDATLSKVQEAASKANVPLEAYVNQMTAISRAGQEVFKSSSDVSSVLQAIHQSAQASGATLDQTADIINDLTNEMGKGAVGADVLIKLNKTNGKVMDALAKSILGPKGTAAALVRMGEEGKLSGIQLSKGLMSISEDVIRASGTTKTFGGVMSGLSERIGLAFYELDKGLGITDKVIKAVEWLSDKIKTATEFVKEHSTFFKILGATLAAAFLPQIIAAAAALLGMAAAGLAAAAPFILMGLAILGVAAILEDFWNWFNGKPSVITDFIGPIDDVRLKLTDWFEWIAKKFEEVWNKVKEVADAIKGMIPESVLNFVSKGSETVSNAAVNAGAWVGDKAVGALDWVKNATGFGGTQNVTINQTNNIQANDPKAVQGAVQSATDNSIKRSGLTDKGAR